MRVAESAVRAEIIRHFLGVGRPPTTSELAHRVSAPEQEVAASVQELARQRSLVLRPNGEILTAHPFSAAPTPFWVSSRRGSWWGACAWCSLGIAALLADETRIISRLGAEGEPVELTVRDGEARGDAVVHFALPAADWGADLGYSCATILLFADEAAIDGWCARHHIPRGVVLSLQETYELAADWFGDSCDPGVRPRGRDEWQAVLTARGLTGEFWQLR